MTHSKNSTLLLNLFIWLKEIFYGSKNWFFFSTNMLQRIEPFLHDSKEWFFFDMTQRIEPSSEHVTFKNWTSFFSVWLKRIEPFFCWTRSTELNPFVKYDSKNWKWLKGLNLCFVSIWLKELYFLIWLKELNPIFEHVSMNWTFFFSMWLKELNPFLDMTQRIELSFLHVSKAWALLHDSKTWSFFIKYDLQELNLLKNMTQRIEPLFLYDSQNWTFFWICLKELNPF